MLLVYQRNINTAASKSRNDSMRSTSSSCCCHGSSIVELIIIVFAIGLAISSMVCRFKLEDKAIEFAAREFIGSTSTDQSSILRYCVVAV